jgi:ribosomal protein S18 acetylase RimI-like enzyme
VVNPDFQNRGVGTKLLLEIECTFPSCGRFELFTGSKSTGNIHLYEKLGYREYKTQIIKDDHKLVFLEKTK